MKYRIAIIGAGQLGSRYLQGMASCKLPLEILVVDPSENSLIQARDRWTEVSTEGSIHSVDFLKIYNQIDDRLIDIVIIATNSGGRADLITDLSNQLNIRYWVIEKVLAQSRGELKLIAKTLENYSGSWVNTPRRMIKWYQEMYAETPNHLPTICTVNGKDWGLACNAIHFIDLVAWWSGEDLVSIQTDQLEPQWHKAKRSGYWEIFGTLIAKYSSGSKLVLSCSMEDEERLVTIKTGDYLLKIQELNGTAERSDGKLFNGKLEFQSEITERLVESILRTGECNLPDVSTSIQQHQIFIDKLLDDWNLKMPIKISKLPIT